MSSTTHRDSVHWLKPLVCVALTISSALPALGQNDDFDLKLRSLTRSDLAGQTWNQTERSEQWRPRETAVVICDMWDYHHSRNATARVGELAVRMNQVVSAMRDRGALVVHAPSDCMDFYADHPARKRAQAAPVAANLPEGINTWCDQISGEQTDLYPIDQSDGGRDDDPEILKKWRDYLTSIGRNVEHPWKRQIDKLSIDSERDIISDRGAEIWNVMEQRGIKNVVLLGVHANMCVLGRPFGLRQMAQNGRKVALMRDLTDTMYNPAKKPFVSHYRGTDLIVQHIEKYVAPTITSDQIIGGQSFRFRWDVPTKVVIAIAEPEYQTWETLPALANKIWTPERGFDTTIVIGDPNQHDIPGLVEALTDADVLVLSVRRQALPSDQLQAIRNHFEAGKPLLAIRTSSHAFFARGTGPANHVEWPEFDAQVLGGNYQGHYGHQYQAEITIADGAAEHPILTGLSLPYTSGAALYKNQPLPEGTGPVLLMGAIEGEPREPVAWVHRFGDSKVFYTSLGHPSDFAQPAFEKLLWNAMEWMRVLPSDVLEAEFETSAVNSGAARQPFQTAEGLAVDLVAAEPTIGQPVFLNFDERGRMWVVQYRQYPHPAGLKIVSRDSVWRNVYDQIPPPPPHDLDSPFRGADRITIHEDTNGDGCFDKVKTFVDGLNMATSVVRGRGGVWVMNPPYLMFYPDRDNDDLPDSDPVVVLKGFGLEDSHSIANSLRWGPDGWLYGAQGSTVSADVVVVGDRQPAKPIHTVGQQIWRYHPEQQIFEVYAEGGGNAFGCEIDQKGRVFSGHNGGNTRGFHYVQGGYLSKGFAKHGALSNPYAYGYFQHMPHPEVKRFTHNFLVYEGGELPQRYHGKIFGVDPMNRNVPVSDRIVDGATFRTTDIAMALKTDDAWFRPVDIKHGPDGAIYVADWYDAQVNHYRNHEGQIDKLSGRIYRLRADDSPRPDAKLAVSFDHSQKSTEQLIELLRHPNRWHREQARRLIGDRRDAGAIGPLKDALLESAGQDALEYLWALNLSGGFDESFAARTLCHDDPYVRLWTVRLLGDRREVSTSMAKLIADRAAQETNIEARSQLAASAKRFSAPTALPMIAALMRHDGDEKDRYLPLQIWWALESKCERDGDGVVDLFDAPSLWQQPVVQSEILWRLMSRFAASGKRGDMIRCARLLEAAPDAASHQQLMVGFEHAFQGRSLSGLPARLLKAMGDTGGASLTLRVRSGDQVAIDDSLEIICNSKEPLTRRITHLTLFGEIPVPRAVPVMIAALDLEHQELKRAALTALQAYDQSEIASEVLTRFPEFDESTRDVAHSLLSSRLAWTRELVDAVTQGRFDKTTLASEQVARLRLHQDAALQAAIDELWGAQRIPAPDLFQNEIVRLKSVLATGVGSPYDGKPLFLKKCAACHRLFADGGNIGPDLTAFQRKDLDNMLLSIVNPSAQIRAGFENFVVLTDEGRVLTGFKADQDEHVVVIRGADGQSIAVEKDKIEEIRSAGQSLMPDGLLADLTDQQLRDFFAYFRTTQPLVGSKFGD